MRVYAGWEGGMQRQPSQALRSGSFVPGLPSPSPSVPPLPKGEALAGRDTFYWTPEVRYGAKGRALLQRAAASGQALLVKLPLAWTAEHYRFRDIVLCSSRRKLTDMPMALPLGELAGASPTERASRLSQSRCTAISRLFVRAILSQCKSCLSASLPSPSSQAMPPLPRGEALAGRKAQRTPFGDCCSERGGLSCGVPLFTRYYVQNRTSQALRSWTFVRSWNIANDPNIANLAKFQYYTYLYQIFRTSQDVSPQ